MKNPAFYILCGLISLSLLWSCDSDSKEEETPQKETLILSQDKIEFTIFGGISEITVKGKDNAAIDATATPTGNWFDFDLTDGTLKASADINGAGANEGSITLSAEGYEDAVITLSQLAPATILWDNPSAYYMNLGGGVKSVSFHDYLMRETSIKDLEFDKKGWLTSFGIGSSRTVSITYDSQNRISEIITSDKGTIKLAYGTHGQYISTEDLFFKELPYSAAVLDYQAWMPLFIKNLSKVELIENDIAILTYDFKITGNSGKCFIDGDEEDVAFTFTVANNFYATSTYGSGFYASESTFNVDVATGKLSKIDIDDPWGAMVYNFNNDRINSCAGVESDDMPSEATYNKNLDVATIDKGTSTDSYDYVYDNHNNWIERTKNDLEDKERTIEYWD